MDGQRARLVDPVLDRVPTIRRGAPAAVRPTVARPGLVRPAAGAPHGRLAPAWAAVLGLGWPLAIVVSAVIEPAPAEPAAAEPLIVSLAGLGLLAAIMLTVVAAARRHPSAAVAGVVAGLIALVFTVTCPVTGHHGIGAWWFGQLAVTMAMLGASAAALGRRARAV
ncbi:MAG TPA: hypothetical protein VE575_16125 [Acidimicrobiales bacterium]|jgi:hypothetical protein|nr:hypothetical protein [Acidimicrobiales bacterium]